MNAELFEFMSLDPLFAHAHISRTAHAWFLSMAQDAGASVRQRKRLKGATKDRNKEQDSDHPEAVPEAPDTVSYSTEDVEPSGVPVYVGRIEPGSYWLTRITFIRALAFLYCN